MLCSVTQFCLTLQNPMMTCSLPGSSVHGVSQARMLEWVPISLSINPRVTGRVTLYCSARIHTRISKGKRYMGWNSQETRLDSPCVSKGSDMKIMWVCPAQHETVHVLLLFSLEVMSDFLWPHGLQYTRLPCPSLSPRVCSNSCPLSRWCHPATSSSVVPFSSSPQSFQYQGLF